MTSAALADGLMGDSLLLFGATGMVGTEVLRTASPGSARIVAVTRQPAPPQDSSCHATWLCGGAYELARGSGPWPDAATVLSAGPLDALSHWLERVQPAGLRRLVAIGSTSIVTKAHSADPAERALAQVLMDAEARLIRYCESAGVRWTLLRPTLIWGRGDRNLSRLAAMARRFGFIALPAFARGRRQPIRARDVAIAMLAAVAREDSFDRCLDLPGGETLPYDEMARRIAAVVAPPGRIIRLPALLVAGLAAVARRIGPPAPTNAALHRMREDLVFDDASARAALGIRAGPFDPGPDDFHRA